MIVQNWSNNCNHVANQYIIRRHDRPALLDRGALEVDARVEEGVVHPRDGAAVGVAVQQLVALAALKIAMRISLD